MHLSCLKLAFRCFAQDNFPTHPVETQGFEGGSGLVAHAAAVETKVTPPRKNGPAVRSFGMNQTSTGPLLLHGGGGARVPLHTGPVGELPALLQSLGTRWVVLVDQGIPSDQLTALRAGSSAFTFLTWPGGESCKTRESKAALEDRLLALPLDPSWGICAVGGGALLDLAGYVASGLFRGLRLVLVPTTLLAMVDASVGSKNGINHPLGKNLLGTLYDPAAIWLDPGFIDPMPLSLLQQGAAEMIKHALIGAREQLPELAQIGQILMEDRSAAGSEVVQEARRYLVRLLRSSIQVKDGVVARSLVEPEWRHILNAGHTFAHGWEAASAYTISHGKAVGAGLWLESQLACELGQLQISTVVGVERALLAWRFHVPPISWQRLAPFLLRDKKHEAGRLLCSLPSEASTQGLLTGSGSFSRTEVQLQQFEEIYHRCQPVSV